MDGVKGCVSDRGLTTPEAKKCIKDRSGDVLLRGDVDDPGRPGQHTEWANTAAPEFHLRPLYG